MNIIISLDIGTSKIAAVAFDCGSRTNLAVLSVPNSSTVSGLPHGHHEQDPRLIRSVSFDLFRQLMKSSAFSPSDVKGLAISAQMHGIMLVDKTLNPLTNLITWCDRRAETLTASINRAEWPVKRTGSYLHPGYGAATLSMLAREGKIPSDSIALSIGDYIAACLCGVIASEPTNAASWGIMDIRRNCWERDIVSFLDIPYEILPVIRSAMSVLGTVSATDCALPGHIKVYSPLGDNQASFIGVCGFDGTSMLLNLGTGGQISLPLSEFEFLSELETRPMPFGGYLQVGASLCGGRSYAYLKDFFRRTIKDFTGQDLSDSEIYESMNRIASASATALNVDTRFDGARMSPSVRGSISGIAPGDFTPGALSLGFLRGIVRELTGMISPVSFRNYNKVFAGGNAVRKNPLLKDIISEESGLSCVLALNSEEAATGAAFSAAKAAGLLS